MIQADELVMAEIIGRSVDCVMDRPLGSRHPRHQDMVYPVNYGYVPGIRGGDGAEQDVYLLGVEVPVERFTAQVIAVVHRLNDVEDKWVAAPEGMNFTDDEILEKLHFQEQYFESVLLR